MADTSSNSMWVNADQFDGFELSRPQIFREETRELFFNYFRIKPSDNVLDGGCATGVLTRFIAKGLGGGTITGFDISQKFVDYGNQKIAENELSHAAKIVLDDGFALSFADNTFDAVISHNYLGVLSDPVAGMKEMIRVCKQGGNISVSTTGGGGGNYEGEYPIEGIERLRELKSKYDNAYKKVVTISYLKQSEEWTLTRYPILFSKCGLKDISIKSVGSVFAYNDNYWSDEYRIKKITANIDDEIRIITENNMNPSFAENGFTNQDYLELIGLLRTKQDYLLKNYRTDESWEWSAGLHCIITGRKPLTV